MTKHQNCSLDFDLGTKLCSKRDVEHTRHWEDRHVWLVYGSPKAGRTSAQVEGIPKATCRALRSPRSFPKNGQRHCFLVAVLIMDLRVRLPYACRCVISETQVDSCFVGSIWEGLTSALVSKRFRLWFLRGQLLRTTCGFRLQLGESRRGSTCTLM